MGKRLMSSVFVAVLFCLVVAAPGFGAKTIPLKIGAGAMGGTMFPMMTSTMVILNENIPGLVATVAPGNSIVNIRNVDKGTFDLGLTYLSAGHEAWNGMKPFEMKHQKIRAIGNYPRYPYQYAVPGSSDIKSIKDLANKRINATRKGSGTELALSRLIAEYGLSYEKIKEGKGGVNFVSWEEGLLLIKDRHLDFTVFDNKPPDPNIMEIETVFPVRVLNIEESVRKEMLKKYPGYIEYKVPAGTYKGQKEDAWTIGWAAFLVVREDLDADLVYEITKAIYENPDKLAKGFDHLKDLNPKMAVEGATIPFHPGAAKYFKEKGVLK